MFGFLRRRKAATRKEDPLAAYDQMMAELERQAGEVRKSAATLLALRAELSRDVERYEKAMKELSSRLSKTSVKDPDAARVLKRDLAQTETLLASARESWARVDGDSRELVDAAEGLQKEIFLLREERSTAKARLMVGTAVTQAFLARVDRIDKVLALESARDDIERAHALAQIYREDRQK